jgi:hypothetical protein
MGRTLTDVRKEEEVVREVVKALKTEENEMEKSKSSI